MRYTAFFLSILLCSTTLVFGQSNDSLALDKVIAVVDNKIILQSDLQVQLAQMKAQGGAIPPNAECLLFGQMLMQKLLVAQANKDSVMVTPEEVESELDRRMSYFIQQIGSRERLEEYYKKPIVKLKEEFREAITDQLQSQRMQQKVAGEVKVSPMEVRQFFDKIPKDSLPLISAQLEIGEIILTPKISIESKEEAKQKLMDIKKRIVDYGLSFENQAKLYSEDPGSGPRGGDLGMVSRGDMVPEFEAALFKLKDGQVSNIVETQYGYHIIKMISRQGEKAKAKHILITPKSRPADLEYAKSRLDSVYRWLIHDSIEFSIAVSRYTSDENSKLSGGMMMDPTAGTTLLDVANIAPDVFFYIDTMAVGRFSKPHFCKTKEGKDAVRILYLRNRTAPHQLSVATDYAKLQELTQQDKQDHILKNWIHKTVAKNYIQIDPAYQNCPAAIDFIQK